MTFFPYRVVVVSCGLMNSMLGLIGMFQLQLFITVLLLFCLIVFFFHRYLQQSIHGPRSKTGPSEETPTQGCIVGSGTDSRVCSDDWHVHCKTSRWQDKC